MSRTRIPLLVAVLACLVLLAPGVASAGVRIGIGFGTAIGPHHHHHMHGWYGGVYAWPHYYGYDPWYDPWWYYPAPVVVAPPVVRERVIVRERQPPAAPRDEALEMVSEKLQQKKSESLRKLQIGDASSRIQAVKDLQPFAVDSKVRTALEKALLSDKDAPVRKAIAELFGKVQDKKTLPVLKQAQASDANREVRQAAYKAIMMMEGY